MGSRRELLKKSLGISEYPWSSDDDLDDNSNTNNSTNPDHLNLLRRQPEPRQSVAEAPGTSGLQPQSSSQVTARKNQAKLDRDLFWSILNSPHKIPLPPNPPASNSPRNESMPMMSSPALGESSSRERPERSNNRVISFKHLLNRTRSTYSCLRHPTLPSERAAALRMSRLNHSTYRRPTTRNLLASLRGGAATNNQLSDNPQTPDEPLALTTPRPRPPRIRTEEAESPHVSPTLISVNSGDDTDNSGPSTSNHENTERGNLIQYVGAESSSNNYEAPMNTSSMSLEEEIVEIDLEEPTPLDNTTIELDDDNAENNENQENNTDPESGANNNEGVERKSQTPSQPNQNRRKRRNSGERDPAEPTTVKEFNKNLLRLLECPVCLEWMEPPMCQCRRGHLVCGRCRARLAACPVCRTTFSSVRNRAMEGVAELLRYPCRHGCGRQVRLRRRVPHEASCASRHYSCPSPACRDRTPMPRHLLAEHFQTRHQPILKIGARHTFSLKLNAEMHDSWLIFVMDEYFHLRIDIDMRVILYVTYIGPKCDAKRYTYKVSVNGEYNHRHVTYARSTHSDLENPAMTMSRHDCFHLTLDQALNFLRFKNRTYDTDKILEFNVEIAKVEPVEPKDRERDDSDS